MYKRIFTEKDDTDLNELIGWLKGQFKTIKQVKTCAKFKALSESDQEYVLDELKADGFKESVMKEAFKVELSLSRGNVQTAMEILNDIRIKYTTEGSNVFIFRNKNDYIDAMEMFKRFNIETY